MSVKDNNFGELISKTGNRHKVTCKIFIVRLFSLGVCLGGLLRSAQIIPQKKSVFLVKKTGK